MDCHKVHCNALFQLIFAKWRWNSHHVMTMKGGNFPTMQYGYIFEHLHRTQLVSWNSISKVESICIQVQRRHSKVSWQQWFSSIFSYFQFDKAPDSVYVCLYMWALPWHVRLTASGVNKKAGLSALLAALYIICPHHCPHYLSVLIGALYIIGTPLLFFFKTLWLRENPRFDGKTQHFIRLLGR